MDAVSSVTSGLSKAAADVSKNVKSKVSGPNRLKKFVQFLGSLLVASALGAAMWQGLRALRESNSISDTNLLSGLIVVFIFSFFFAVITALNIRGELAGRGGERSSNGLNTFLTTFLYTFLALVLVLGSTDGLIQVINFFLRKGEAEYQLAGSNYPMLA